MALEGSHAAGFSAASSTACQAGTRWTDRAPFRKPTTQPSAPGRPTYSSQWQPANPGAALFRKEMARRLILRPRGAAARIPASHAAGALRIGHHLVAAARATPAPSARVQFRLSGVLSRPRCPLSLSPHSRPFALVPRSTARRPPRRSCGRAAPPRRPSAPD